VTVQPDGFGVASRRLILKEIPLPGGGGEGNRHDLRGQDRSNKWTNKLGARQGTRPLAATILAFRARDGTNDP